MPERSTIRRPATVKAACRTLATAGVLLGLVAVGMIATAQETVRPPTRFRESVSLDTDIAVTKKLKTAEDYLRAQQWGPAIELLDEIIQREAGTLVPVATGRYVNAAIYSHLLLSRLPADGLAAYRREADPQSRGWFEEGRRTRNAKLLRRVLQYAYSGTYGDDALLLLGEWAWEQGRLDAARRYWKQLLPADGKSAAAIRYPDPQIGAADILARLMLCSLAEGDFVHAERERERLRRDFPNATGELAGRKGRLAAIAGDLIAEAKNWALSSTGQSARTFAGGFRRSAIQRESVDVGAEQWSVRFSERERQRFELASRQPAFAAGPPLSVHPVVHDGMVLFCDADRIYAFNLRTGKPAWPGPADEEENGVIYQLHDNLFPVSPRRAVGVPRFSMTVCDGRLYARMGTPLTSRSEREPILDSQNALVVLDLDPLQGQGKLLAKISADGFGPGGALWSFDGSPVVAGNRIYAVLCRSHPQMQLNVACFDGDSGRVVWNRKVCAAVSAVGRTHNLISHRLLTLGEERLFLSTGLGAVAALDAHDGTLTWVLTYDSSPSGSLALLSDHMKQGLVPCVYDRGTLFAAPADSNRLFAIDAQSGKIKWQRRLRDRIRHLLGIGQENLIVSGNSLWGLDVESGEIAWGREITDPEYFGYGRGLLVGDAVWWPTRETIEIRSQRTGLRVNRQPILLPAHGTTVERNTGGNLLITAGYLLVAQADRLVAYGEFSLPFQRGGRQISQIKRLLPAVSR